MPNNKHSKDHGHTTIGITSISEKGKGHEAGPENELIEDASEQLKTTPEEIEQERGGQDEAAKQNAKQEPARPEVTSEEVEQDTRQPKDSYAYEIGEHNIVEVVDNYLGVWLSMQQESDEVDVDQAIDDYFSLLLTQLGLGGRESIAESMEIFLLDWFDSETGELRDVAEQKWFLWRSAKTKESRSSLQIQLRALIYKEKKRRAQEGREQEDANLDEIRPEDIGREGEGGEDEEELDPALQYHLS
jgi:hypothetical protein